MIARIGLLAPPGPDRRDDVLDMHHAVNRVEILLVDGEAGVGARRHLRRDIGDARLHLDADDLRARHHHLLRLLVREGEDAVDQFALAPFERPGLLALAHEDAQFLLGIRAALARIGEAEATEQEIGAVIEHRDQRPENDEEDADRADDQERHPLRVLDGDALRQQFAHQHRHVGDEQEGEDHRDDVRRDDRQIGREPGEGGFDQFRDDRLAEIAEGEPGDGDADLGGGDVRVEVVQRALHPSRAAIPLGGKLFDPTAAGGDETVLGRDEIGIQKDDQGKHRQPGDRPPHFSAH